VLQVFLSSPKATLRFAAVKTLSRVAMAQPAALKSCNLDLENLVTDSNRSIATLAITTLLKTGSEQNVDRLMKQIASFLAEIGDEFKGVVVRSVEALCLKFPAKHATLMGFLASLLREEGGFEYKRQVVDSIVTVVRRVPEAREAGLGHLCEFIEDCEYTTLLVQILHIVGREGPAAPAPRKYVRFIYNRLILENATVRAAAVQTLARFGAAVDALRPSVLVLLKRCLADGDDEVRDRAALSVDLLEAQPAGAGSELLVNAAPLAPAGLVRALDDYAAHGDAARAFDLAAVPLEAATAATAAGAAAGDLAALAGVGAAGASGPAAGAAADAASAATAAAAAAAAAPAGAVSPAAAAQLAAIPQFAAFGLPLKSTASGACAPEPRPAPPH
jgi:coatomer protein complex subunit gamma